MHCDALGLAAARPVWQLSYVVMLVYILEICVVNIASCNFTHRERLRVIHLVFYLFANEIFACKCYYAWYTECI